MRVEPTPCTSSLGKEKGFVQGFWRCQQLTAWVVIYAKMWQCDSAAPGNTDTHTKECGDGGMSLPPYGPSNCADSRLHIYLALLLVCWLFLLWTALKTDSVERVGEK